MIIKKVLSVIGIILVIVVFLVVCSLKFYIIKMGKKEVNFVIVGIMVFFFYVKDGKLIGFDIEVVKVVFKGLDNYKVIFKKIEWLLVFIGIDLGKF